MGHKVHPGGLRVGIIHTWKSNWFTSNKDFAQYLREDYQIRDHINGKLSHAGLSDIHIRKDKQKITVDIYTARPGIVIGKSGAEVDALRRELHDMTGKAVQVNITEIKRPELDARLVAQSIAEQLQNRVSFRRAMKRSLSSSMRSGAQGVKVRCGGRLGGSEMSRSETYSEGRVPLHTLRADIDYGFTEAKTTFGRIGVKVWINKGEIMPEGFERDGQSTRLGEVDSRRRRRGALPGEMEQLGPSRPGRREGGGGGGRGRGVATDPAAAAPAAQAVRVVAAAAAEAAEAAGDRHDPRRTLRRPKQRLPTRQRPRLQPPRPQPPRRPHPDAGARGRSRDPPGVSRSAATQANQIPQGASRSTPRAGQGPHPRAVRRVRAQGARDRVGHQPPDRGRPYRDDPQDQARWQGLDHRLSRTSR